MIGAVPGVAWRGKVRTFQACLSHTVAARFASKVGDYSHAKIPHRNELSAVRAVCAVPPTSERAHAAALAHAHWKL